MKVVIQRVTEAQVDVAEETVGQIGEGMLIFVGIGKEDTTQEADILIRKIIGLRIFEDDKGKMNLSALEQRAEILIVSQFTLYGDCDKGRRPSFDKAAEPEIAEELYNYLVEGLRKYDLKIETGRFRAMMEVSLVNDGPVTFILESNK